MNHRRSAIYRYRVPHAIPIPVSDGSVTWVDWADRHLVAGPWNRHQEGYVYRGHGVLIHRVIMGAPSGRVVDHGDGDPNNNRRSNLQVVSYSLNGFRRHRQVKSATGIPGVSPRGNRFGVYITVDYNRLYVGMAGDLAEAAQKRAEAELLHYGEISPVMTELLATYQGAWSPSTNDSMPTPAV